MIRTLDRYVFREVAQAWVAVTGVLLVILVANQLARVLGQAAANGFPRDVVFALIGYTSVQNLTVLVPIGLLLAVVLALGRLYHESEMSAVRACGVGSERLYLPVFALAVLVAAFLAWLSLEAAPRAGAGAQALRNAALRDAQFGQLEPGKFRSFAGGNAVFYAEGVDPDGLLRNVFVERQDGARVEVVLADRAEHRVEDGGRLHIIVLYDGVRYEGVPGRPDFRELRFREHGLPVRLPEPDSRAGRREAMPTAALLASDDPGDRSELQWRLSLPLMVLVLALLAVPLSSLRPRQGRYARVGLAILVYFIYSNLISAARVWIDKGQLDPALGVWWVHALVVALALVLLDRATPLAQLFSRARR